MGREPTSEAGTKPKCEPANDARRRRGRCAADRVVQGVRPWVEPNRANIYPGQHGARAAVIDWLGRLVCSRCKSRGDDMLLR